MIAGSAQLGRYLPIVYCTTFEEEKRKDRTGALMSTRKKVRWKRESKHDKSPKQLVLSKQWLTETMASVAASESQASGLINQLVDHQ